jgi:hypothetical protein
MPNQYTRVAVAHERDDGVAPVAIAVHLDAIDDEPLRASAAAVAFAERRADGMSLRRAASLY